MTPNDKIYDLRFNINHYGVDYTVDGLVRRMIKKEFIFPDFQREYVWNPNEASQFIESLLLGIPVPSLFFAKDKYSQNLIVIDGQQRLRTLQFFFGGKFPSGKAFKLTSVAAPFEGKTFQDLDVEDKFNLENAVNRGKFNDLIRKLASAEIWEKIYKKEDIRLEGQELILRFLAFTFFMEEYKGSLVEFLNDTMLRNRNLELISEQKIEAAFGNTFSKILEATNGEGFYHKGKFNKTLFDTLSVHVARSMKESSIEKITALFKMVKESEAFWRLSKGATTSKKSLFTRLEFVNHLLS